MTAEAGLLGHIGIGGVAFAATTPQQPGPTGGGDVLDESARGGGGPLAGADVPGGSNDVAGEEGSGGGGGGAGGGGGGDGSLPFTGFAAALVAAVGAGLAGAGKAARDRLRRRDEPGA